MTPKEKSNELKMRFGAMSIYVIDEILNELSSSALVDKIQDRIDFWLDVRNELN